MLSVASCSFSGLLLALLHVLSHVWFVCVVCRPLCTWSILSNIHCWLIKHFGPNFLELLYPGCVPDCIVSNVRGDRCSGQCGDSWVTYCELRFHFPLLYVYIWLTTTSPGEKYRSIVIIHFGITIDRINSVFVQCNLVSMFEIVLEFCAESLVHICLYETNGL